MRHLFRYCAFFWIVLLISCSERTAKDVSAQPKELAQDNKKTVSPAVAQPSTQNAEDEKKLAEKHDIDTTGVNSEKQSLSNRDSSNVSSVTQDISAKKTNSSTEWEEGSPEDEFISNEMDMAALQLHKAFKDSKILSTQQNVPIHILLAKKENGIPEVIFSELLSTPGEKHIKTGKELRRYTISNHITFLGDVRHFWLTKEGTIDFFEEDKIFRPLDKIPQADIILVPINSKNPRKNYLDIIKEKTLIYSYQTVD